jgi:hypothetical protein
MCCWIGRNRENKFIGCNRCGQKYSENGHGRLPKDVL